MSTAVAGPCAAAAPPRGRNRRARLAWHLERVNLAPAWAVTRGSGVVIAVIDDAVDIRHPEFAGRIVAPRDIGARSADPCPRAWQPHGTKCAGVALARGALVTGVAPQASLMPVRVETLASQAGDVAEAEGIRWAASQGADVVCCAWGPAEPSAEMGRLPAHTRDALDWAVRWGRNGKGCVIVFSAGNDSCDVALNGYATHPKVIAVGACDYRGKRCSYSNWGDALWCVFPSGDPAQPGGLDTLILTTTPIGSFLLGETFYSYTVGHTSTAAAGVAGLCALMLCVNPNLTWQEVKQVLRDSCVKIDRENGSYDPRGRSPYYGYGRPDAARAVQLAIQRRTSSRARPAPAAAP